VTTKHPMSDSTTNGPAEAWLTPDELSVEELREYVAIMAAQKGDLTMQRFADRSEYLFLDRVATKYGRPVGGHPEANKFR